MPSRPTPARRPSGGGRRSRQADVQSSVPGGSQRAPASTSLTPSPQRGARQSLRQRSGSRSESRAPWSHSSSPSTRPFPQTKGVAVQSGSQPSAPTALPSSHSSSPSTTPLPQKSGVVVQSFSQ